MNLRTCFQAVLGDEPVQSSVQPIEMCFLPVLSGPWEKAELKSRRPTKMGRFKDLNSEVFLNFELLVVAR